MRMLLGGRVRTQRRGAVACPPPLMRRCLPLPRGGLASRRLAIRRLAGGRLAASWCLPRRRLPRGGFLPGGGHVSPPFSLSGRHAFQASAFPFAHAAPHAVPLVAAQRVVQTLDPNGAVRADALGFA